MNMIDSNYHTHLALCRHAEGTVAEYVDLARKKGYKVIGFSDHGPLSEELTKQLHPRRMTNEEYYQVYLPEIKEAKSKNPDITILSAVEIEFFEEMIGDYPRFAKELDYIILGHHFIKLPNGKYFGVYGPMNEERIMIYADEISRALDLGYFRILAHPELYLYSYRNWDDKAKQVAEIIIDSAIRNNVLLEINANGFRKDKPFLNQDNELVYVYPRIEFWRLVKEKKAKAIINDDCHSLSNFCDRATQKAYKFAKDLGIDYTTRF